MLNFVNKNKLLTYVKFYFYYIINCRNREFMIFNETKTHEITVDVVIVTMKNDAPHVLLVKRNNEPFKDKWAIPGGYVRLSENLDQAALRVLKERTNIDNVYLEQLYTFGDPLRHPNARVITCAYFALVRAEDINILSSDQSEICTSYNSGIRVSERITKSVKLLKIHVINICTFFKYS